jgi:hypothetical protein
MKRIVTAAALAAAISFATLAVAQNQDAVTGVRPAAQASAAQQARLNTLRSQPGAGQISIGRVQPQILRRMTVGQLARFQVTPDRSVSASVLAVETRGDVTTWRGEVAGQGQQPPGVATLVITGAGVTGTIHSTDGRTYQLRPLPGGETAIIEIDYNALPQDHPPQGIRRGELQLRTPPVRATATPPVRATVPIQRPAPGSAGIIGEDGAAGVIGEDGTAGVIGEEGDAANSSRLSDSNVARRLSANPALLQMATRATNISLTERYRIRPDLIRLLQPPTIDLLVAYTSSAQTASGDITGLINLAVEETNGSFTNSNVWARVRLVGTMAVSYNETTRDYDTIITHFASNGDGQMDNVHTQRDAVHADVVVLMINQDDWCGQAREIGANASQAFVIVHWSCATGYYSFGHEIGHLLGARHDEPTDTTDTPYVWGHGFRHQAAAPNGWRTIMGYRCGSNLCNPRLQYWSSPLNTWAGLAMGTAGDADNRRVWNERAATVAAFR